MGLTDYTFGDKRIWQAGREYERERIIKLVKKWQEDLITGMPYTTEELAQHRDDGYKDGFDYLIALIKGEK